MLTCSISPSLSPSPHAIFRTFFRSVFSSILDPGTGYQKTGRLGDKIELSLVVRTFHSFSLEEKGELLPNNTLSSLSVSGVSLYQRLLYRSSVRPIHFIVTFAGNRIFIIVLGTSLYQGSLYRASTVFREYL